MALSLNLFFGLIFVIGISGWGGYGFPACPIVTTIVEWAQLIFVIFWYCYKERLHEACWPEEGWTFEHVTRARMFEFSATYFPAALSGILH